MIQHTPSEVFLPLIQNKEVLFTRRSHLVDHHKGQISFPGGMQDPGDVDLQTTALRETCEELGVELHNIEILGSLPVVHTGTSGFAITPFFGNLNISNLEQLKAHPIETDLVFTVPLLYLRDQKNMGTEVYQAPQGQRVVLPVFHFETHRIWGATAKILKSYLDLHP